MALSVGRPNSTATRVYPLVRSCVSDDGLRGIAPFGVRTFLPPELLQESDPPPFQNRD